jgi:hypothetical protein
LRNRYAGRCQSCGEYVRPRAGNLVKDEEGKRWLVYHLKCNAATESVSNEIITSGGTFYRNRKGRCEDAPCCGCCTI